VLLGLVAESREQHTRGCLLLSANMERAVDDEEIARLLEDKQERLNRFLPIRCAAGSAATSFVPELMRVR
jgi:hypothetical protein